MALNDQVNAMYAKLLSNCVRLTKDKQKAYDLLHEVLIWVYDREERVKNCERIAAEDKLYPYLYRAIYLNWVSPSSNYRRKYREIGIEYTGQEIKETWNGSRIDNEQLDIAISRLPEFDAMLFRLYILPDFNINHLSDFTGITPTEIRRSIRTSKQILKNVIVYSRPKIESRTPEDM